MSGHRVRLLCIAGLLSVILGASPVHAAGNEPYDRWPGLVQDIFKNRPIHDGRAPSPAPDMSSVWRLVSCPSSAGSSVS